MLSRRVGFEEIALAAEDIVDAGHAGRNHGGGSNAIARRHAAKIERLLDVVWIADMAADAGRLLRAE